VVRQKVEEKRTVGFHKDELTKLTFAKKDIKTILRWEHSREFEYRNEMYDIVSSSDSEDSIIYICYRDIEEIKIKNQLEKLTFKDFENSKNHQDRDKRILDYLKQVYYFENDNPLLCHLVPFKYVKSVGYSSECDLTQIICCVPYPPPEYL